MGARGRLGAALAGALLLGCGTVGSAMGGHPQRVGDVWFVRTSSFFGLPIGGGSVWYCAAPPQGTAQTTCTEATIDEGDVSSANATATESSAPADAASSATAAPPDPALGCGDLRLGAALPVQDEVSIVSQNLPTGGVVADGTYVLIGYTWHLPATPYARRTVLRVRGGRFEMAFSRDAGPEQLISGRVLFAPQGRVVFTVDCPQSIPLEFVAYTATPSGLILYSRTPAKTATFSRQ